jgi:hypothetical protein
VHQWRATTLTLLSQRSSFRTLLMSATEATLNDIMTHLNHILPPPPQHAATAISTLRTLLTRAVTLAVEMRTQRAEYVMKRAPWPEYDDHGEVSNTVFFRASQMHANNVPDSSDDHDLEAEHATVKCVLFPLIIRRGNEFGEEYESEHIVYPMQVLVNRAQLRSESRSSIRSSMSMSSVGTGGGWRDDAPHHKHTVSRLTPITDHSPRTTPEKTRRDGEVDNNSPSLPRIPEQTIRLVERDDEDEDMERADEPRTPTAAQRYVDGSAETKKRRVSEA